MVGGSTTIERYRLGAREVETTLPAVSMPGTTIRPFRRRDRQRVLIHDGRLLTPLDTRAE